ncbi:MAG TPA: hypothetical protein PLF26_11075 [Blastocatellia bacterium]|nr:hypothetical protein [Blastocatellia bacterium]
MPRTTRAGRGAFALGIVGLALLSVGVIARPLLQLATPARPRADVAATRHRLVLLTVASRNGNIGAANAIAGSIAAGIGVDTPEELAADATQLSLSTDPRERELAIAHATGVLDALDLMTEPESPVLDLLERLAVVAGGFAAAVAIAMLNRTVRRQHHAHVVRQMLAELPAEPSRRRVAESSNPPPDYGRIVAVTHVEDP